MNTKEQEEITENLFDTHGYKPNTEIFIPVEFIYKFLYFLDRVDSYNPPSRGAILQYPKKVNEIRDKETKELERVDTEWIDFPDALSFFQTNLERNKVPLLMTELGFLSYQLQEALLNYHKKNIQSGVAIEVKQIQNNGRGN